MEKLHSIKHLPKALPIRMNHGSKEMGGRSVWALSVENPVGLRQVTHGSAISPNRRIHIIAEKIFCSYNPFKRASDVPFENFEPVRPVINEYASTLDGTEDLAAVCIRNQVLHRSQVCRGATD